MDIRIQMLLCLLEHLDEPSRSGRGRLQCATVEVEWVGQLDTIQDESTELLAIHLPAKDMVAKELSRQDVLAQCLGGDAVARLVINNPLEAMRIFYNEIRALRE